jgi:hypothetical protein
MGLLSSSGAGYREKIEKILSSGTSVVAFLLPLKLSLAYIALSPLIVLWAWTNRFSLLRVNIPERSRQIAAPLIVFFALCFLSATVGISPWRSFRALSSLVFFSLTIPLFAAKGDTKSVCLSLLAGQSVAALHSCMEAAYPGVMPPLFLGKVTESGQLTISIFVALGVIYSSKRNDSDLRDNFSWLALAILITLLLTITGFSPDLGLAPTATISLSVAIMALALLAILKDKGASLINRERLLALTLAMPLMICALLVNLKRGPWLGTLVGTVCLACFYSRKLVAPLALGAICAAILVTPIRERILDSYEHFTIAGGRSTIWRIGAELVSEYPLGIGYHNSGILREFSPEIPPELKHFHNNLLNIAAETGWLGVSVFLWLIIAIVKTCFKDRATPLYVALGCAVISWQCAGLVEYNFGDSEVTILIWILLGLIIKAESTCKRINAPSSLSSPS